MPDQGDLFAAGIRRQAKTRQAVFVEGPHDHRPDTELALQHRLGELETPAFVPPRIFAGGGVCAECNRPYREAYFGVDRMIAENRPLPPPAIEAELRQRHQALLLKRGAEECPRHCGWALVPPNDRPCTCPPAERPDPCPHKYALSACLEAQPIETETGYRGLPRITGEAPGEEESDGEEAPEADAEEETETDD